MNSPEADGPSPLTIALSQGQWRLARALVDAGTNLSTREYDQLGCILNFSCTLKAPEDLCLAMLARGAPHYCASPGFCSPLSVAARLDYRALALALVEKGADLAAYEQDRGGIGFLTHCIASKWEDVAAAVLRRPDANPNPGKYKGLSALYYACFKGFEDIALKILETPLPKSVLDETPPGPGRPPALYFAITHRLPRLAERLVELGADVTKFDSDPPHSAVFFAIIHFMERTAMLALDHDEKGAIDVDDREEERGNTLLILACVAGMESLALKLIGKGAEVNPMDEGSGKLQVPSPLAAAARTGLAHACEALLDLGAEVDAPDETGASPLELAEAAAEREKEAGRDEEERAMRRVVERLRGMGATRRSGAGAGAAAGGV